MSPLTTNRSSRRPEYLFMVLVTVLLGLASRRYTTPLSEYFGKYPGDALWAMMIENLVAYAISVGAALGLDVMRTAPVLVPPHVATSDFEDGRDAANFSE